MNNRLCDTEPYQDSETHTQKWLAKEFTGTSTKSLEVHAFRNTFIILKIRGCSEEEVLALECSILPGYDDCMLVSLIRLVYDCTIKVSC